MFFIPLNQIESVELVIHALRAAGGEADCSSCPAARVCMKQCLTIAASVEDLIGKGALPSLDPPSESDVKNQDEPRETENKRQDDAGETDFKDRDDAGETDRNSRSGSHLKIIK